MRDGSCGLYVDVLGCNLRKQVLLKFKYLPYVEFHMTRAPDDLFLDDTIKFPRSSNDLKIGKYMSDEFLQANGDLGVYTEILMKYYQNAALHKHPKKDEASVEYPTYASTTMSDIDKEIHKDNLKPFANMVDGKYENAMMEVRSDWSEACLCLIPQETILQNISNLRRISQTFTWCLRRPSPIRITLFLSTTGTMSN